MTTSPARLLASTLFALACVAAFAGFRELRAMAGDEVYANLHLVVAGGYLASALSLFAPAFRLAIQPAAYFGYPFLHRMAFYRWLVAGWLAIFLVLGWSLPVDDANRFLCRALCLFWLALLTFPVAWPSRWLAACGSYMKTGPLRLIDLAVANACLALILLEGALRIWALFSTQDMLLADRARGYRLQPNHAYPNGIRSNSLGFADDEFEVAKSRQTIRIAALGDSFSVGVRVATRDCYLSLLEELLSEVEVYNFGVSGTGPREYHRMLVETAWQYAPDLVLVPIFVGNDITERIASPSLAKLNPDSLYIGNVARRVYRVGRERLRRQDQGTPEESGRAGAQDFSRETYLNISSGRLVVCRREQTQADRERWSAVLGDMGNIIAECRQRGIPLAVLVLPDEFQVNPALLAEVLQRRGWKEEDIDIDLPQRRLLEFCSDRGVPCLDLLSAFRGDGGAAYYPNDSHWNERGNRIAAEHIAPWLKSEFSGLLRVGRPQMAGTSAP